MSRVGASWDAEYRAGRYVAEAPLPFAHDILAAVERVGLPPGPGLYVGCGNGRNYVPLVAGGLDLVGLDVSRAALAQLAERLSGRVDRLVHGDLSALPPDARFAIVVGIQVFQHGREAEAHGHLSAAAARVAPGGLFCVRVNAAGTDLRHSHRIVERNEDGGFTVEYLDGPKAGLTIHFFAEAELAQLADGFDPVLPLRLDATAHDPPATGRWLQWEAIWRRPDGR